MTANFCLRAGVAGAAMALGLNAAGAAEDWPDYDRKIEEAAIEQLQSKLGEFRGPIGLDPSQHIFPPADLREGDGSISPYVQLEQKPNMASIIWG